MFVPNADWLFGQGIPNADWSFGHGIPNTDWFFDNRGSTQIIKLKK